MKTSSFFRRFGTLAVVLMAGLSASAWAAPVEPYKIEVPQRALDDLADRIASARWPDQLPGTTWEYGADIGTLKSIADYWQSDFDWRAAERRLNRFDQFTTEIDGQKIHFIHQQSPDENATPLLLIHGWPGSVAEFTEIIGPLTDPGSHDSVGAPAFDIIAPSLPGFSFSGPTADKGWDSKRMAAAFLELMTELGYERFAIQGGDFGSIIGQWMARIAPERVTAIHTNFLVALPPSPDAMAELSKKELQRFTSFQKNEMGYFLLQETKPQTIAYSLNDSPIGLLAWHAEKFQSWTDNDGSFLDAVSIDAFLTNLTIYWLTQTSGSSARLYREGLLSGGNFVQPPKFDTPIGHAVFPKEVIESPERWNSQTYNVVHRTVMPEGGHFAAMEQPRLLVDDIRAFFARMRQ